MQEDAAPLAAYGVKSGGLVHVVLQGKAARGRWDQIRAKFGGGKKSQTRERSAESCRGLDVDMADIGSSASSEDDGLPPWSVEAPLRRWLAPPARPATADGKLSGKT